MTRNTARRLTHHWPKNQPLQRPMHFARSGHIWSHESKFTLFLSHRASSGWSESPIIPRAYCTGLWGNVMIWSCFRWSGLGLAVLWPRFYHQLLSKRGSGSETSFSHMDWPPIHILERTSAYCHHQYKISAKKWMKLCECEIQRMCGSLKVKGGPTKY